MATLDEQIQINPWGLVYETWEPEKQPLREALCTLGNGYFATRGAAEEADAGGVHYPGTYLAGGYNRLESRVAGRVIENEDLVNWPNWLCLTFRVEGQEWFHIDSVELLDFRQSLDLRQGILERRLRFRQNSDRETSLVCRRLIDMSDQHRAAIEWTLTPENWSGNIEIRSRLDGSVRNEGVERYKNLSSQHLDILGAGQVAEDGIFLKCQSNQSHIQMVQAARTRIRSQNAYHAVERETETSDRMIEQHLFTRCEVKRSLRIEKTLAVYTSRDFAISEPKIAAFKSINRAGSFEDLLENHASAWSELWNRANITIGEEDSWSQVVLRLHIFHLLQVASFHSIDLDVGIPARGLHGEAYRGHIFWDEIFIFPFLNLRIPELTRTLLMYRYRRLGEAIQMAEQEGYRGAMYPWQSGSSGRQESQIVHLNPRSKRWVPDNTHRQRHINAAIAFNIWQYFEATRDIEFLSFFGAEMMLQIARFWASIATYNPERDRYEIHHVVGPDEFHTEYPDSEEPGLRNNAYTNVMAAWTLCCAQTCLDTLAGDRAAEVCEKLRIEEDELAQWDRIRRKMFVPFHDGGIISQFEGYGDLEELDWKGYEKKYGDIQRLDRILEAENDSPNRYKASKQADVLMLFYLFSAEELERLIGEMGYDFDPECIPKNIQYYLKRTSHGSTLSRLIHSWVISRSDRESAWHLFTDALESDVADIQGGTTSEGVHLGAMAGTVDLIQRCYTGLEMREQTLWINPALPESLSKIQLRLRYQGHWLRLDFTHEQVSIAFEHGWCGPVQIGFQDKVYEFSEGDQRTFSMSPGG